MSGVVTGVGFETGGVATSADVVVGVRVARAAGVAAGTVPGADVATAGAVEVTGVETAEMSSVVVDDTRADVTG